MSFNIGEPPKPPDEMFYNRSHAPPNRPADDEYRGDMVVHKDLFETINEAHYLPELGGPHDEALLESLVEKGCEDNQILGQTLDKLAHLVHSSDYTEEEEEILLNGAPVADIIDRLEQSLESPSRSSITAAQGLLNLHNIGDQLPSEHDESFMTHESPAENHPKDMSVKSASQESGNVNNGNYKEQNSEKKINNVSSVDVIFAKTVPEKLESLNDKIVDKRQLPDQNKLTEPMETHDVNINTQICELENKTKNEHHLASHNKESIKNINDTVRERNMVYTKEQSSTSEEMVPTDLSIKHINKGSPRIKVTITDTTNPNEDNISEKSDEQPKDLTVHRRFPTPHASPRRIDFPRAPSRESDAMQSPQPSGIPAIPSSPEIFTVPPTKSKQTLFLETLLSSPSPKMYTSEVSVTKQQCEPLNLGKHRKSASPTVSSCSDEIRKLNKEFGEPQEKKIKKESSEDLVKATKASEYNKPNEEQISETKSKKPEKPVLKFSEDTSPVKQLQMLKTSSEFNIPDPLLVPKDKLNDIISHPGREIPALLVQRPELRLPEAFAFPAVLQDPNILVVSLTQLENILENNAKKLASPKQKETKTIKNVPTTEQVGAKQADHNNLPKPIPSMDALAGDIDAATSAALNQMLWLPYLSQLEAMAACSQNMDFLKALNSAGYTGSNYPDLSQMFNPTAGRFMGQAGFPMMPPMEYDSRLQFAMWQEAMNHANIPVSQRPKPILTESQLKEHHAPKSTDVQNPFVHSTKSHPPKTHSSARTSPIVHNYNTNQRSMHHHPYLPGMYPGMNPNMRPTLPLPGLQIPYFNPNLMGNQRSPRAGQQKSPTSPYYPNNNYLQSVKQSEIQTQQRSGSATSQESPRPRISVKSLHNLMDPGAAASSSGRKSTNTPTATMGRRREETEVGSTTPLVEQSSHLPPMPHDPSSYHLWHPLFGNTRPKLLSSSFLT